MIQLPEGTVTFLFTDVEGSTRLWEEAPDLMMEALRLHDAAIDAAIGPRGGTSVKPRGEGDSRFIVFSSASEAVQGAAEMQRLLAEVDWPTPRPVRVRASLHTGLAELELGDYYGSAVNRAARLRAIAHGGQTLLSAATHDLVQDHIKDGVRLTDRGWHRLKDLTRPEHVYQLDVFGLEEDFPPLRSLDAVPNNLPEQVTELIGRDRELAQIEELLRANRLVTILAPGGTGKTHLSIQAAANLTASYPDGAYFIELANIPAADDIAQMVAETVGVALSSEEDPRRQLLDYLKPRTQLLIFDNFEHLSEGADLIADLLRAAPEIDVIVTSRARLGVTGEAILMLEGLATSWATPDEAFKTSGVRLFVDAGRRINPDLTIGEDDLTAIGEILRLTGGTPLGVLLAAAWVDLLSITDIAVEIAKNLDFLESIDVDMPERHRSVRAVFQYSWDLLSSEEQQTFAALSIFRGGFTREAAEVVAGASLRDLAGLVRKSLLRADSDMARYSVHELLRQFAELELAKDPKRHERVLEGHGEYYAALAHNAFEMFNSSEQRRSIETMEPDMDNIRFAWRYYVEHTDPAQLGQMVEALWCAHELRGWYHAGLSLLAPALDAFRGSSGDPAAAVLLARLKAVEAAFGGVLGRLEVADADSEVAVTIARNSGDRESLLLALHLRAQTLLYLGRIAEIPTVIDEAVALGQGSTDWPVGRFWIAGIKNIQAFALLATGEFEQAESLLEESRAQLEPAGELWYMAWNCGHRARLAMREGRVADAVDLFTQSAERARELGGLRVLQIALFGLGDARHAAGDPVGAREAFVESLGAAERTGMVAEMLATSVRIAKVMAETGETNEAVELLATVEAEPDSRRRLFIEQETISDTAARALAELEPTMDEGEFIYHRELGTERHYRDVVKQLVGMASGAGAR